MLLSGSMTITNRRVFFRSYFNEKTLFGKGTRIIIPYEDIVVMEKKCFGGMKMFPNSLEIKLTHGQTYFFTSFLKNGRKFAYNLIKPLSPNLQPNVIERNGSTIIVTSSDSSIS